MEVPLHRQPRFGDHRAITSAASEAPRRIHVEDRSVGFVSRGAKAKWVKGLSIRSAQSAISVIANFLRSYDMPSIVSHPHDIATVDTINRPNNMTYRPNPNILHSD